MTKPENVTALDPDAELADARAAHRRVIDAKREAEAGLLRLQRTLGEMATGAKIDEAAQAFIAGGEPVAPATIARQIDEARGRVDMLARAKALSGERVTIAQRRVNGRKLAAAKPTHLQNAARVVAALCELSRALEAEEKFRASQPPGLPNASFPGIGWISHSDSPVRHWLRYAAAHQLLPANFKAQPDTAALAAE